MHADTTYMHIDACMQTLHMQTYKYMHACMHACKPRLQAKSCPGWIGLLAEGGRPLPTSPPRSHGAPASLAKGKQLSYSKERRNLKAPDSCRAPLEWSRSLSVPTPTVPSSGRAGPRRVKGPALLHPNKAHRWSPRPRSEPMTKRVCAPTAGRA